MSAKKKSISLSEFPKAEEYEEFISSIFQLGGCFTERRVVKKEEKEILELDIILTDYSKNVPEVILLEAKSGDWGFSDIFKIRGWMDYLNIDDGILIFQRHKDTLELHKKIAAALNIGLYEVNDIKNAEKELSGIFIPQKLDERDVAALRYSCWMERNLIKRLKQKCRSVKSKKCYKVLRDYYFNLNSSIFFEENLISRIYELYEQYMIHPNISAKTGNELSGNSFEEDVSKLPDELYQKTFYSCEFNDIQISTFVEHRARLAILKNAIDYKLYKSAGDKRKARDTIKIKISKEEEIPLLDLLPISFQQGLEAISKDKYFHKYPIFWQLFMWLFGGFILIDYEKNEKALLSRLSGIPVKEISNAFRAYGLLFPHDEGWFMDLKESSIRLLKMFPVPFCGIGAFYRTLQYGKPNIFRDIDLSGMHTHDDLINWHMLGAEVLKT